MTNLRNVAYLLLIVAGTATKAAPQSAIDTLRSDFAGDRALCRVTMNGLHATTDVLGRPSEMRVTNGVLSRGASRFVHGSSDVPIAVGQLVRVAGIESGETAKNDVLRVTVRANGAAIPVAFLVGKGTLASMTEHQLQALIEQVFEPVQNTVPPAATAVRAGAAATPKPPIEKAEPQRTPIPSEDVLELNGILKHHGGDAILKIEGVHAAMQTPDNTRDNVVIDGVFQPRQAGGIYRGSRDIVLWPNSQVQFVELSALSDNEHDILHLVVRAAIGGYAPISFLLPKGQLSTLQKKQIMQIMEPFVVFAAADSHTFTGNPRAAVPAVGASPDSSSLHASHPPDAGCLWEPYASKKFDLELLREHCTGGHNDWKLADTPSGIGMSTQGPPQPAFDVFRKPAAQPIETAIHEQIIMKFKDPAARTYCRAIRSRDQEEPGWNEYQIEAFGTYAHPKLTKEEQDEKDAGPELCGGMYGGDVSTYFVYNPEISRTHFFAFYGLSDPLKGLPYDIFSLRFRSEPH